MLVSMCACGSGGWGTGMGELGLITSGCGK